MGFAFIREGDTTSHGGRVLACSPENKSDGVPLALLGDKVSRGGLTRSDSFLRFLSGTSEAIMLPI